MPVMEGISAIMFALVWLGIARAIRVGSALRTVAGVARLSVRNADPAISAAHDPAQSSQDALALISLAGLCLQIILDGLLHVYGLPHYYCGAWIITVLLAWLGADALCRCVGGRAW